MPAPSPGTKRTGLALAKTVGKFALAWWAFLWLYAHDLWVNRVDQLLEGATARALSGVPALARLAEGFYGDATAIVLFTFAVTLWAGTGLAVLGGAGRLVARARTRAGQTDFLDRLRAWTAARPGTTRALLAAPTVAWTALLAFAMKNMDPLPGVYARSAVPLLLAAWGMFAMTRKGLRELLAPTMGDSGATRFEIAQDEIAFDAVAVTRRTLAIVAGFTVIVLGVPAIELAHLLSATVRQSGEGLPSLLSFAAYVAFAATGPFLFRRASRIAVGVDGVHVRGTSRARFFAYRDLDSARTTGSSIELLRRGKVVLRLQLHGEDAARREAVLARVTENIARAREGRGAMAAQIVASSSKDDLARAAQGAGDYRVATLTREQLWALVEGPEVEASARKAAAEALVASSDDSERARLRVAAEHCAEPQVRIALEEIAGDEGDPRARVEPLAMPPTAR